MSDRSCPACGSADLRHLKESSAGALCDYYRCEACRHIWAVFQNGRVHHVTPLKPADEKKREAG